MIANPFLEEIDVSAIEEEISVRLARKSYLEYVKYTNQGYKESKFHKFLCDSVQEFMETDSSNAFDILLLSVPPQFGKSTSVTETLPAWYLGKNPDKKVIICGYNEDFAVRFGRRNKEKIEEFNSKVFPDCVLATAPCSNVEFETTMKGRCISRGIMSGLTGNTADLFIIDDCIKNRQEADSETTRNAIWNEYLNSVRTRIKPHGKLIVIATRWHEEDIIGMIQKVEKNFKVINIPCECDSENDVLGRKIGDSLCPEIGRGNAWLKEFKQAYVGKEGSRAWTALYQGKPVAMEGNLIKREWWQYYDCNYKELELPYIIISVDAAFKDGDDNDFVAIQVWGKKNEKYYLLDALKKHLNFVDTLAAIRNFKSQYEDTIFVLIEDKANGTAIINVLSSEMEGVIPVKPEGGKVTRANAVSPAIEAGHVYLPRFASFVDDFIAECSAFPNAAHDDQVDAMTQALNRMLFVDADVVAEKYIKYTVYTEDMYEDLANADDELRQFLLEKWGYPLEDEIEYL
jgi:predicted phage terminase large subunit-like protein